MLAVSVHQQIELLNEKLDSATGSKEGHIHTDGSEPDSAAAWKQSVKKCTLASPSHHACIKLPPFMQKQHLVPLVLGSVIAQ